MSALSASSADAHLPASGFEVERVVSELALVRQRWREARSRVSEPGGRELPSRDAMATIFSDLRGVLFPMRLGPPDLRQASEDFYVAHTLDSALHALLAQTRLELRYAARRLGRSAAVADSGAASNLASSAVPNTRSGGAETAIEAATEATIEAQAVRIVHAFSQALPQIREQLDTDVMAAFEGDPAARSVDEVVLCYPGILAMIHHRLAHCLYLHGLPLLARIGAELAHSQTGIDIHPGAEIGTGCFIDHGTGVVIGETAIIGRRVRIYQAVTLGAKRFPQDADGTLQKGLARHPVVEDDVVLYAGATVLGRVTLGRGAVIGGNVWVTQDVAPGSHVTQAGSLHGPGRAGAAAS